MKNYFRAETKNPVYANYVYVDTKEHLADTLFIRNKVYVKFEREYAKEGTDYVIIFCRVRKKEISKILKSFEDVDNKMALLGHSDYNEFCENTLAMFQ